MHVQIQWFIVETERDSGYNSMTQSYSHEKTRPIKFPTLTAWPIVTDMVPRTWEK